MERDFEFLRAEIHKHSNIDLSTSTLRRIWSDGHAKIPQAKTLDALAQTIGFRGWHDFKASNPVSNTKKNRKMSKVLLAIGGIVSVIILSVLTMGSDKTTGVAALHAETHSHNGVPATIGFQYTISDPDVEIELSWNPYERVRLNPSNDFYTGTYFYPDYHHAKLLLNNQVLASETVHVTTDGWHGLIMDSSMDTHPYYLEKSDFLWADKISVSQETLMKHKLEDQEELYTVFTLSNEKLDMIDGDHFSMEFSAKSQLHSKASLCGYYEVLIKGTEGMMRIPVSEDGCYGIMTLKCGEKVMSGKSHDLSALTTAIDQAHRLNLECKNGSLSIALAENTPFLVDYEEKVGSLKVIKFIFNGMGEVSGLKIFDSKAAPLTGDMLVPF